MTGDAPPPAAPTEPPKRGDHIVIIWPGGPHNFRMEFDKLDASMPPPPPGWLWLHGKVGETKLRFDLVVNDWRTLYARPVADGVYEMVPRRG